MEGGAQAFIALSASLWQVLSSTAIQPTGAFTQARMDTTRPKTAGADWQAQSDQGTGFLTIGDGATAGVVVGTSAEVASTAIIGIGTDAELRLTASSITGRTANVTRFGADAANGLAVHQGGPLVFFTGLATGEVWRVNATSEIHRATAAANANSHFEAQEYPITNGDVIAVGDLVMFALGSARVSKATAGAAHPVGVCISGGTGNAGGTVLAVVAIRGIITTIQADTAGVTQGQLVKIGAVDPNQVDSQATIEGTFGKCLLTAADNVATIIDLNGPH